MLLSGGPVQATIRTLHVGASRRKEVQDRYDYVQKGARVTAVRFSQSRQMLGCATATDPFDDRQHDVHARIFGVWI